MVSLQLIMDVMCLSVFTFMVIAVSLESAAVFIVVLTIQVDVVMLNVHRVVNPWSKYWKNGNQCHDIESCKQKTEKSMTF